MKVAYHDKDGTARTLYFDYQYNDSMSLQHEDARQDSIPLDLAGLDPSLLDVRLLAPTDLALSKLSRFADVDRGDIRQLAECGLIDATTLRRRAEDALAGYIGNLRQIRFSIEDACRIVMDHENKR